MFDDLERRYLLQLANDCRCKGMSLEEATQKIREQVGLLTSEGRVRCAIAHVFASE